MSEAPASEPITREDLESKFRELSGEVSETAAQFRDVAIAVAVAVGAAIVVGAFLFGRSRGRKKTTVVEIRRV